MSDKKNNRFLDWVNADTGLPTLEELEAQHHHDDHDGHDAGAEGESHGEHGEHGHDGGAVDAHESAPQTHDAHDEEPAPSEAETDDALEPLVLDEAMQYPDPVSDEGDLPEGTEAAQDEIADAAPIAPAPKAPPTKKPMITREQKAKLNRARMVYGACSTIFAIIIIAALLLTVSELPPFGSAQSPTVNEVYHRYIEQGRDDTGAVNIVAAMILDYRAFDTLGESLMLFTATMGVVMLIRNPKRYADKKTGKEEKQ